MKRNRELRIGHIGDSLRIALIEYTNTDTYLIKAKIGIYLPHYMDFDKKIIDRSGQTIAMSPFNISCH